MLRLAHQMPLAGHLGRAKNPPNSTMILLAYCTSRCEKIMQCSDCQLVTKGDKHRAPLVSLPIMGDPWRRIAMDVLGPLPRKSNGNRFIHQIS